MNIFRNFEIPVIVLSSMMQEPDRKKIDQCIEELLREQELSALPHPRESYFRSELQLGYTARGELTDVIRFADQALTKHGYLPVNIPAPGLLPRFSFLTNNGVLFHYEIREQIPESVVSVISCRHRLSFEGTRCVSTVLYLLLRREDETDLAAFYQLAKETAD